MSLARSLAISLVGLEGELVEVQCDISSGLPGLSFTGLPDTSVVEARDRVRSAVLNSGATWPQQKITVALLPADLRKVGSRFDLALAGAGLAGGGTGPAAAVSEAGGDAGAGAGGWPPPGPRVPPAGPA